VGQANGNVAALPYVAETLRNDPSVYPTSEVFKRLNPDQAWPPAMLREIARAWTRIQTGE
jgi:putrescine transport system substrate-binding protein